MREGEGLDPYILGTSLPQLRAAGQEDAGEIARVRGPSSLAVWEKMATTELPRRFSQIDLLPEPSPGFASWEASRTDDYGGWE